MWKLMRTREPARTSSPGDAEPGSNAPERRDRRGPKDARPDGDLAHGDEGIDDPIAPA